jgi:hypothetical protein
VGGVLYVACACRGFRCGCFDVLIQLIENSNQAIFRARSRGSHLLGLAASISVVQLHLHADSTFLHSISS